MCVSCFIVVFVVVVCYCFSPPLVCVMCMFVRCCFWGVFCVVVFVCMCLFMLVVCVCV